MSAQDPSRSGLSEQERVAALRDIQSSEKPLIVAAAKILSRDSSTKESLLDLLRCELRADNRQGILYALSWHASLDTWDLMVNILGDSREDPKVRGQAAEAISYMFMKQQPESEAFKVAV